MTTTTRPAAANEPAPYGYRPDGLPKQHPDDDLPRPMLPNPWRDNPNSYYCPWGCNGSGYKPWFYNVANGVCFGCEGRGWILGRGHRPAPAPAPAPAERRPLRHWQRIGNRIEQIGET